MRNTNQSESLFDCSEGRGRKELRICDISRDPAVVREVHNREAVLACAFRNESGEKRLVAKDGRDNEVGAQRSGELSLLYLG